MNPNSPVTPPAGGLRASKTLGTAPIEKEVASQNALQVTVRNPDKVVFEGIAQAVSSRNEVGPFDVLPQHENFISLISGKITIWLEKHQKQEIESVSAIMKAKSNKVDIFLGVESLTQEEAPIPQNPGLKKPLPLKETAPAKQ